MFSAAVWIKAQSTNHSYWSLC